MKRSTRGGIVIALLTGAIGALVADELPKGLRGKTPLEEEPKAPRMAAAVNVVVASTPKAALPKS
jgi:hypothetical protein